MSDPRIQRMMLIVAIAGGTLFIGAVLLCDLFPPPAPDHSAEFWVQFWSTDTNIKRLGVVCGLLAGASLLTLPLVIFQQLRRIDGPGAPLAYLQLGAGVLALVPGTIIPFLAWSPLVYRPGSLSPEITQYATDFGMFAFFLPWIGTVQMFVVGLCVLKDYEGKVLPRWFGYVSLWVGLSFVPAGMMYWFTDGPMAWNGLLPWWLGLVMTITWGVCAFIVLFKAIAGQEREEAAAQAAVAA